MRSATYVLAALAAGFILGSLAAATSSPVPLRIVAFIEPLGSLWVDVFRPDELDGIALHPPIARFLRRWQQGDPCVYLGARWAE